MFTQAEIELLNDAIAMAVASNRRMQVSKPRFHQIFNQIINDLEALKVKINTPVKQK